MTEKHKGSEDGIIYVPIWDSFSSSSIKNLSKTILSGNVDINLARLFSAFFENEESYDKTRMHFEPAYLLNGVLG